ncbi:glycosyltransferase family 2 protein [Roseovarius sp. M141]|uniref:glycosyltransferase family 2 protein n=1 Tax=Roseovarius sp. M141 TaxID=2583806 RepID=UPI0020CE0CC1|nr:glycosyltransferase family 2 protein [Roseovarius sp. M141]MCQ0092936.1 glycosyltransferase family 2 protein [Roseovarius sp. M141]
MTTPAVLVIVLNYRTPDLTVRATRAALLAMEGIVGAITVVDNASGDDSCQIISQAIADNGWDRVTLMQAGRNGGFGAGNNHGMLAGLPDGAVPDYIYILNSDAWPEPDAIRLLLDVLEADPQVGFAGSHILGEDGVTHRTAFRFPSIAGEFEGSVRTGLFTRLLRDWVVPLPIPQETARVDWVAGASMMIRRRMLDEIGLFDETFFLYFEETDLCLRAARAGWICLYVPASRAEHLGSVSTGMRDWSRTPQYWFDSRQHYFHQNHGAAYAAAATLSRIAGEGLWRLRCLFSSREQRDPPYFMRDLTLHALRRGWPRRTQRAIPMRHTPAKESENQ